MFSNMKQIEPISARLREAMTLRGKKQVDLVRETGIDKGSISHYLSGRYEPKQEAVNKLAVALNVSVTWLSGYDVPMERVTQIPYDFSDEDNPHELAMREVFETLDVDDQIIIKDFTIEYAENPEKMKKSLGQIRLTEGETVLLDLFRRVPEEQQQLVLQMIRAALGSRE